MAHATDYQSRTDKPLTKSEVSRRLVKGFLNETNWTKEASKRFCLDVYSHHGLTESIFESTWKEVRNVSRGSNQSNRNAQRALSSC